MTVLPPNQKWNRILLNTLQSYYYKLSNSIRQFILGMSTRKNSLKQADRTLDLTEYRYQNFQPRQRKNSSGFARNGIDDLNLTANLNIGLDEKLTAKLVFVKKLEKLQKDAIKYFYDHRVQQCFQSLQKCLLMLQQRSCSGLMQMDDSYFPEHRIYIRYLQAEFSYKVKKIGQSRDFYEKAIKLVPKLNKAQKEKTKQYLISLQALNACLLYEEGRYTQSVKHIEQIQSRVEEGKYKLNQKSIRNLCLSRIQSLIQLGQFKVTIKLVQSFISKWGNNLSNRQKYKLNILKAKSYRGVQNLSEAETVMEQVIESFKKGLKQSKGEELYNEAKCYLSKSYHHYVDLFHDDPIKSIYIAKKWQQQCQSSDHATVKLFHLFYQIGDFEQSLVCFSELSENYKKNSEDWQKIAEIKQFYGQKQTSEYMLTKALETSKSEQRKLFLEIKLLYFSKEETRKQQMKAVQKKIKDNRYRSWIQKIIDKYGEYLEIIGEQSRMQKISKLIGFESKKDKQNDFSIQRSIFSKQAITHSNNNSGKKIELGQTGRFGVQQFQMQILRQKLGDQSNITNKDKERNSRVSYRAQKNNSYLIGKIMQKLN